MPPPHTWFACKNCHTFFPTLERGLTHLINSPLHTTETLDLINRYGNGYLTAAARLLYSFELHTDEEHERAIGEARGGVSLPLLTHPPAPSHPPAPAHRIQSTGEERGGTCADPITVRVTLSARPTHAEAVFTFVFARETHNSVEKLLQGVAEAYGGQGDVKALGRERLMMQLAKRNGARVGGDVWADEDVRMLGAVVGGGWWGQMEVG